jgi:hypothetical protein
MKHCLTILSLLFALGVTSVVPAVAQKAQKKEPAQSTVREVLMQYVGKATNLGTLKKVTADHFVLEEDGSTVVHPLSVLHTIKASKDEETGEVRVEIRVLSKD